MSLADSCRVCTSHNETTLLAEASVFPSGLNLMQYVASLLLKVNGRVLSAGAALDAGVDVFSGGSHPTQSKAMIQIPQFDICFVIGFFSGVLFRLNVIRSPF